MSFAGGDLEAFVCMQRVGLMVDDEGEFACQDVEELAGLGVVVRGLGCARGHQFFDDVEGGRADEVTGVAGGSPGVVFGGDRADGRGGHGRF